MKRVQAVAQAVSARMRAVFAVIGLPDLLIPTGFCCLIYGAAKVWPPLGWIVAGALMTGAGAWLALRERKGGTA